MLGACLGLSNVASAQAPSPAASDDIVLGTSTALSGPVADIGLQMLGGMQAALAELNRKGGICGRAVRLVALDDGYEPERTIPNVYELVHHHHVTAIVGDVGTPTAVAAMPIASRLQVPFFGALTGAGFLRPDPPGRWVVNVRASYAEETAAMVDALVTVAGLEPAEIALFTQRDAYGDSGYAGAIEALRRHGLASESAVTHGVYERNTLAIEEGLATILSAARRPRAIILVGTYAPCAKFIRTARAIGLHDAQFLCVSFAGATSLASDLGADGDGVLVTQVMPHFASDLPLARDYRAAVDALDPPLAPSFGGIEGYAAMRVLEQALSRIKGPIDRASLAAALDSLGDFDIGMGVTLHLDPGMHQASHEVWLTRLEQGRVEAFEWSRLAEAQALRP